MRSVSNTFITFPPFISLPVKTYTASDSHSVSFNFHHVHEDGSASKISRPYMCNECGESVAYGDLVKGQTRGETVLLVTEDELSQVESDAGKEYEVLHFVHADDIPLMLFGDPYFLEADEKRGKSASETYATLHAVLVETRQVGVVKYTNRGKTHLATLRPEGDVLVLQNIRWPDELRDASEVKVSKVTVNEKAVKLMTQLVENMSADFNDPSAPYVDMYAEGVKALLDSKESGVPMTAKEEADAVEDIGDLLAALEQSIKNHPAGKGKGKNVSKKESAA